MTDDDLLLEDLREAEAANGTIERCAACDAIASTSDVARSALSAALAGTIGGEKLSKILNRRGYAVGRRAIMRHRREGHTP